jgi:hypothetical protein
MSYQPPYEIKLEYMKAKQAHEVAMYRAKTARRLVYLWAFIALASIISVALINFRSNRIIEGTPLVRPVPLAIPYVSTPPQQWWQPDGRGMKMDHVMFGHICIPICLNFRMDNAPRSFRAFEPGASNASAISKRFASQISVT